MTAEPIAAVIADLRACRVRPATDDHELAATALARAVAPTVVDATTIYESLAANERPVYLYEDHPCIAPPWDSAAICYVNQHGNVIVMQATAERRKEGAGAKWDETAEPVDWAWVPWIIETFVWIGGRGGDGRAIPTFGPTHLWQAAVYEGGQPADLRWVHLCPDYPREHWDMAHLVLLGALNFMNCRNVELMEPQRPRPERRRLARLGVTVRTINVFPVSRSSRGAGAGSREGVPLASVRGHFASYGPEYGRGLLFGRHAGRFWIPQHARGSAEQGESQASYRLVTGR